MIIYMKSNMAYLNPYNLRPCMLRQGEGYDTDALRSSNSHVPLVIALDAIAVGAGVKVDMPDGEMRMQ